MLMRYGWKTELFKAGVMENNATIVVALTSAPLSMKNPLKKKKTMIAILYLAFRNLLASQGLGPRSKRLDNFNRFSSQFTLRK